MDELRKDLFVLIIGHGRGGTSAVTGFLNAFPQLNIGFEINVNNLITFKKSKKNRFVEIPKKFNGNKIILGGNLITSSDVISCINEKKVFVHDGFKVLKIISVRRDIVDTICSQHLRAKNTGAIKYENLTLRKSVKKFIIEYDSMSNIENHFKHSVYKIDFYEFLKNLDIKIKLLKWIGINIDSMQGSFDGNFSCGHYGTKTLNMSHLLFGPNSKGTNKEIKNKIRELIFHFNREELLSEKGD